MYIEQNLASLRKEPCTKQLIILPNDDIYAESDDLPLVDSLTKNYDLSLFVNDCLKNYLNRKYETKYKYHLYGGNFRQLPNFYENSFLFDK